MACRFSTRRGAPLPSSSSASSDTLTFEMVSLARPMFASLVETTFGRERRAGMPLFTLARAAIADTSLRVIRVKGDGKCMFRAIALGLARNQGRLLGPSAEEQEADQLRLAVAEALCRTHKRRSQFGDAVIALEAEDKLPNYCKRIMSPSFWGGEPELLVLSKMLHVPIFIYLSNAEAGKGGSGYTPIQKYGEQYTKASKDHPKRRPVRILYSHGNHYDLLVK